MGWTILFEEKGHARVLDPREGIMKRYRGRMGARRSCIQEKGSYEKISKEQAHTGVLDSREGNQLYKGDQERQSVVKERSRKAISCIRKIKKWIQLYKEDQDRQSVV